jgi:hypothetical protein
MQKQFPRRARVAALLFSCALAGGFALTSLRVDAQTGGLRLQLPTVVSNALVTPAVAAPGIMAVGRPQYEIDANIDYDLLTLQSSAKVQIPASSADPLRDAVFFLYANAGGVGGDDARRKNLVVDRVSMGATALPFKLDGAVLRVALPSPQTSAFTLKVDYHGVVPRAPKEEGGLSSLMGGALGGDISSMLGIGTPAGEKPKEKPKNTDYGLYTYGNGILSLGSFWYPALAVRQGGRWADAAPEGLGDVAYAEKSDFAASIRAPQGVTLVAPGQITRTNSANGTVFNVTADDAREFALLLSEDYASKSAIYPVGGRNVTVTATLLKKNAAKLDKTLDVAGKALQIFSKRFGAYPFGEFKVVEAPMKGGAGGMEYSRVIGIASMLYDDIGAQLGGLTTSLSLPGADKLLESLGDDTLGGGEAGNGGAAAPADDGGDANPMTDMVGGILGQQKDIFDSLLETTIAHEVAHQWWAIGVGSDSQRHPFVDESLTNWSAMLYFEDRYGVAKANQMRDLHLKTSFSMGAMMGGGDAPANLPTSAYSNNMQYGAVIYGKGALFYDQLRALVGDSAFFAGLRDYYAKWNDHIAGPDTLRLAIEARSPAKKAQIGALYKRWIQEAHGQEDIGGGMNLDIAGMLGGILGGNLGDTE